MARSNRIFALFFALVFLFTSFAVTRADEGMWIFGNPPLKQLKEKYNFEPSQAWLDHARLAACRLNNGGSGSFVSADGLVLTNHHVARSLLAKLSTEKRDLLKTGFYARTRAEELKCQDLEINVLYSLEDVTAQIQAAAQKAPDAKGAETLRKSEAARIEKESTDRTGLKSTVIGLYEGGEYWLYRFKKYTDIRMVFAPEAQAAEFGGDYDNFSYPRYALDFAFLRVYENDKPVKLEHYYKWSAKGAAEKELVFVVGNPGSTDRLRTVAQLEYQRDHGNLMQLKSLLRRRDALLEYSKTSAEAARRASDTISSINNSLKRLQGQQEGLQSQKLMQQKIREEQDLRGKVAANPEWQKLYGSSWDEMAALFPAYTPMAKRQFYSNLNASRLGQIALQIVQYGAEVTKPNADRLAAYRDSNLESFKFALLSPAPIYGDFEEAVLTARLEEILAELGPADPFVQACLNGKTPSEVAHSAISQTKLSDVAFRKSLIEGGKAAVEASTDPLIVIARRIDPISRDLTKWIQDNFEGQQTAAGEKIARARFAAYGRSIAPDANFSIRLSYGVVKGYELNTTLVPYKTTFAGLFDRAESFDHREPFNVAPQILARRAKIDQTVPMDFVYTPDTIGGNSGSPVINRNGEVVGVNFDSNVHRFVSRYTYTEETGRAIAVHSSAIIETLRKIYDAGPLADEIQGK
ncbi:MAG: S46 family peptidase [Blastocatellia bacterium]|nr:S46 family peptidase [Blastocatellia bacterium]